MNEYKRGDRVVFIKDCYHDDNYIPKGTTGIVKNTIYLVQVEFDEPNNVRYTMPWWLPYKYIKRRSFLNDRLKEFINEETKKEN